MTPLEIAKRVQTTLGDVSDRDSCILAGEVIRLTEENNLELLRRESIEASNMSLSKLVLANQNCALALNEALKEAENVMRKHLSRNISSPDVMFEEWLNKYGSKL